MEDGSPSLADQLATCQQRIRDLEQTDAERQLVVTQQQEAITHQAAVIAQQQEAIANYQEQLAKAAEQLRYFKRMMFGQRRERYAPSPDQKLLFVPEVIEGLETKAQSVEDATTDSSSPRPRKKPRRPRIEFPQFWEHRRTEYPLPPEQLPCGCCGAERIVIRTHVTKRVEMEEAKLYVVEEVRYTYACSACHDGSQMQTTERPPQAVEKSPFGPSILAWLVTWKFLHHLPLYRQQELLLGPLKRWLSRSLLCGLLGRTADERRALRQTEALPILTRMKERFEEVRPTLRPTSKLAEAINYVLNRWDAFVRYTSDGRIRIDNNVIERLLRPIAIGRKNYLFFGSERGGQTAATLYTLVQSARRNCVDVWPYLTDVLRRIAAIAPGNTAALEALLPDRWVAAHPEHRLEQREEESREAQARRRRKRAARRLAVAQ
jgi:transposase